MEQTLYRARLAFSYVDDEGEETEVFAANMAAVSEEGRERIAATLIALLYAGASDATIAAPDGTVVAARSEVDGQPYPANVLPFPSEVN